MPKNKKISTEDMTFEELSDFFDEHDLSDLGEVEEVHDFQIQLKRKKYVGLEQKLYQKIALQAKKRHLSVDALVNLWLSEKAAS